MSMLVVGARRARLLDLSVARNMFSGVLIAESARTELRRTSRPGTTTWSHVTSSPALTGRASRSPCSRSSSKAARRRWTPWCGATACEAIAMECACRRPLGDRSQGHRARRSGDDGLDVDSPSTTLIGNHAIRNGDLGIAAVFGVIDGGRNVAHGNGNPAQSTNVFCTAL